MSDKLPPQHLAEMFAPVEGHNPVSEAAPSQAPEFRPIVPVPEDAPEPNFEHPKFGKPEAVYVYRGAAGERLGYVLRFPKGADMPKGLPLTFCESPEGKLEWRHKAFGIPRPLYGLNRLAAARDAQVLFVEGEKTAKAARLLFPNFVVVTSPGGANAAKKVDFAPLKDRKIVIWPDSDEPGERYAREVSELAMAAGAKSVATVKLPSGLPDSWDLADPIPNECRDLDPHLLVEAALQGRTLQNPAQKSLEEELARLAALPLFEYDRIRKSEADRLSVRVATLDAEVDRLRPATKRSNQDDSTGGSKLELPVPIPFPEPVDGETLLDEIYAEVRRYIVLEDHDAVAMALWIVFSHCFDSFEHNPRLALVSPEKRCGKTTALGFIGALVPKSLQTSNVTAPALFRTIELAKPTFLIDEADTFLENHDELRGILNAGHSRAAPYVIRTVGEDFEPRKFNVYCPAVLAKIGELPATLADRSIIVSMKRKRPSDQVERLRLSKAKHLEILQSKAARWCTDNSFTLSESDPRAPEGMNDRAIDNWRPLLSIAELCGPKWHALARRAAPLLAGTDVGTTLETSVTLLEDIHSIFASEMLERISTQVLLARLCELDDRPWPQINRGKPLSAAGLARLLKRYRIKAKMFRESSERTLRGYSVDDFREAFERYLGSQVRNTET